MRLWNWKALTVVAAVAAGAFAYAAERGERMPTSPSVEGWLADLPAAADAIEPHSPVREAIDAGNLDDAREMLSFRPWSEAPVPQGFPGFTPVGVIEVKQYPTYRKAVGPGFWPLFNHIKNQGIPMTAPVEMTRNPSRSNESEMAFLYQDATVGAVGPVDGVAVEDSAPTIVASLGVRGRMNEAIVSEAKTRLEAWLADQSEYERAAEGDESYRLFGYSSPMVPDRDKYWEAQLLLKPAGATLDDVGRPAGEASPAATETASARSAGG